MRRRWEREREGGEEREGVGLGAGGWEGRALVDLRGEAGL